MIIQLFRFSVKNFSASKSNQAFSDKGAQTEDCLV